MNLDNYGAPIVFSTSNDATLKLTNINTGFKLEAYDDDRSKDMFERIQKLNGVDSNGIFKIAQNSDGVDIEDRIERGLVLISAIITIS